MKKVVMLFIAALGMLTLTTTSYAFNVYTLNPSQLLLSTEIIDSVPDGIGSLSSATLDSGGVWFAGNITFHDDQFRYILLGDSTPTDTSLEDYTHYGLNFENKDSNDAWLVSVFVATGTGDDYAIYSTDWLSLPSYGSTGTALLDLSTVDNLDDVKSIGFGIAFNGAGDGPGDTFQGDDFNMLVRSTPEPSSMLLLGMGILGLFRLGKRKKA